MGPINVQTNPTKHTKKRVIPQYPPTFGFFSDFFILFNLTRALNCDFMEKTVNFAYYIHLKLYFPLSVSSRIF